MEKRLSEIGKRARTELDRIDRAREKVLPACREIVRMASETIKQVHREQWTEASEGLARMEKALAEIREELKNRPELRFAGFVTSAEQEYAEAHLTCAVLSGKKLPGPKDLSLDCAAYLNGMADTIGELRRHVLDQIRRKDFNKAEAALEAMDSFYLFLFSLDYPDAIMRGLRRKVDADRSILERTRSDFILSVVQEDLRKELRQYREKCDRAPK